MKQKLTMWAVTLTLSAMALSSLMAVQSASAAIALDRTRVILDGGSKSVSLGISNQSRDLPFLAQAWVEDAAGNKITSPLMALPPVQRVEAGAKGQVKVQTTGANLLAQDRETLFYFNLREIPPKSKKPNTLQIALQTRVKLFFRPVALQVESNSKPWQEKIILNRRGDSYIVNNPTPYFVTIVGASAKEESANVSGFKPLMIAPQGSETLPGSASALGSGPVLTYINDYGGRPKLIFSCAAGNCKVSSSRAG